MAKQNQLITDEIRSAPVEILLADASVEDLHVLLSGLRANVKLMLVTNSDEAPRCFQEALQTPGLDTLHILGHGNPGEVILGGWRLNDSALQELESQPPSSNPLNTEICLWSCRTGAGEKGKQFMNTLANITNATIFASETLVGNSDKGGSWDLNVQARPRNAAPFDTSVLSKFSGVLGVLAPVSVGMSTYYFGNIENGIPGPGVYTPGSHVFTLNPADPDFDYDVDTTFGTPRIHITIGGIDAYAEFTGIVGGKLEFEYIGDLTGQLDWGVKDGPGFNAASFDLNGATITISDGVDSILIDDENSDFFAPQSPSSFINVYLLEDGYFDVNYNNQWLSTLDTPVVGEVGGDPTSVYLVGTSDDWRISVIYAEGDINSPQYQLQSVSDDSRTITLGVEVDNIYFLGTNTLEGGEFIFTPDLPGADLSLTLGWDDLFGTITTSANTSSVLVDQYLIDDITIVANAAVDQTIYGVVNDNLGWGETIEEYNYRSDVVNLAVDYVDVEEIQTTEVDGEKFVQITYNTEAGSRLLSIRGIEKVSFSDQDLYIVGAGGFTDLQTATNPSDPSYNFHIPNDATVFVSEDTPDSNDGARWEVSADNLTLIVEDRVSSLRIEQTTVNQQITLAGAGDVDILGSDSNNNINTALGTGNYTIDGGAGDDTITLTAGAGTDTITVGADSDTITGIDGADNLTVTAGGDATVTMGGEWNVTAETSNTSGDAANVAIDVNGYDLDLSAATVGDATTDGYTVTNTGGAAVITGSAADDTITAGASGDIIDGGAGADTIADGADADTIDGGAGDDTITLTAGAGTDTITVGADSDTITGIDGADNLTVTAGGDATVTMGGEWNVTAETSNTSGDAANVAIDVNGYDLDLSAATVGDATTDGYTVTNTGGAAVITGSAADDTITAGASGDIIDGGAGADTIADGADADTIDGGAGDDTITLTAGAGTDTITVGADSDTITGIDGADNLTVTAGGDATVTMGGEWNVTAETSNTSGDAANVAIDVNGYDLDLSAATVGDATTDGYTVTNTGGAAVITGSAADDTITAGASGDIIDGGAGADTIADGADADTIDGGAGDDTITLTAGAGTDTITVGADSDTITGIDGADNLTVTAGGDATVTMGGEWNVTAETSNTSGDAANVAIDVNGYDLDLSAATVGDATTDGYTVTNTGGAAVITGSAADDTITAGASGDIIDGGAGADTIADGADADTIDGGAGDDTITLTAGAGTDTITVGADSDTITGIDGADNLTVTAGGDATVTMGGEWNVTAETSNTSGDAANVAIDVNGYDLDLSAATVGDATTDGYTVTNTGGAAVITGSAADDTITAGASGDIIDGGAGADTIADGADADTIDGGAGDDTITLTAGAGTDTITVGADSDTITGIDGADNLTVTAGGDATVTMGGEWNVTAETSNTSGDAANVAIDVNGYDLDLSAATVGDATTDGYTVTNTGGAAVITGSAADDTITAGASGDIIDGGAGADTIADGADADTIDGGAGDDTITLTAGAGTDTITVGADSDTITGIDGADNLTVTAGGDATVTMGGEWNVTAETSNTSGDAANVAIDVNGYDLDLSAATVGDATTDGYTVTNTGGAAVITGSAADDTITAGASGDIIDGGAGADTIADGADADTIDGGAGDDTITLTAGAGTDTITVGADSDTITGIDGADNLTVTAGGDATVTMGGEWNVTAETSNTSGDAANVAIDVNGYDLDLSAATVGDATTDGYTVTNTGGAAVITGSAADDTITAGASGDIIDGGAGDDVLYAGQGNAVDILIGGTQSVADRAVVYMDEGFTIAEVQSYFTDKVSTLTDEDGTYLTIDTGSYGIDILRGIEEIEFVWDGGSHVVRVVGGGSSFTNLSTATTVAEAGTIVYVADTEVISGADGNINSTDMNLVFAASDQAMTLTLVTGVANVNIYGSRGYTLNANSSNNIIYDYTEGVSDASITNIINAGAGNDSVYIVGNLHSSVRVNGGAGDDLIIGGTNDSLYGDAGNDELIALTGAAYLSGGAGNDVLVNAYLAEAGSTSSVVMFGGSGSDSFALMASLGSDYIDAEELVMKTNIADLGTSDFINLSFVDLNSDTPGTPGVPATASDFSGDVTQTRVGTTIDLSDYSLSSQKATGDGEDSVNLGAGSSLFISNSSMNKVYDRVQAGYAEAQTEGAFSAYVNSELAGIFGVQDVVY